MQKIYIFTLLVTHIFYNSCRAMERQTILYKPQRLLQSRGQLLFPTNPYGDLEIPLNTLKTTPTMLCATDQLNQEQLNSNNTMYQPFTSTASDQLVPLYRPAQQSTDKKERKPLLRTLNPVIPNEKMIEKLYNKAVDISKEFTLDKFSQLVTLMNSVKSTINEDTLGKYAYELWLPCKHNIYPEDTRKKLRPIFFFGFLKNYNLKIATTGECMPKTEDLLKKNSVKKVGNPLAQEFNLKSSVNITVDSYTYDVSATSADYPAFHAVKTYADSKTYDSMKNFILYIYSQEIPQNKYAKLSYDDLKAEFYNTASQVANAYYPTEKDLLYELIQMIEAGKNLNPKKQEYDFGDDILKSPQTTVSKGLAAMNIDPTVTKRKKIAMSCHAMKEYNDNRDRQAKKTPTVDQITAYNDYLRFDFHDGHTRSNFSFPGTFNSALFDSTIYDFDGFDKLFKRMRLVRYSTDENVQEAVDQINFSQS